MFKKIIWFNTCLLTAACTDGTDAIHFITSSEISIGVDPSLGKANIGYDRNELAITTGSTDVANGESGNIPSLYAELQSNRNLTNPEIIQIYATGDAAARVTSSPTGKDLKSVLEDKKFRKNKRRAILFGTSTNLGLKVAGPAGQPAAFSLGYKRREASRIPLSTVEEKGVQTQKLPSLFAYMRVDSSTQNAKEKKKDENISTALPFNFKAGQLIATGVAADNLAGSDKLRKVISRRAVATAEEGLTETEIKELKK